MSNACICDVCATAVAKAAIEKNIRASWSAIVSISFRIIPRKDTGTSRKCVLISFYFIQKWPPMNLFHVFQRNKTVQCNLLSNSWQIIKIKLVLC